MYKSHPVFIDPDPKLALLWRYLDFTKFVHILRTETLFFPSAEILHAYDLFEGSLPRIEYQHHKTTLHLEDESIKSIHAAHRKETCISCWHWNETESLAMWKLYTQIGNGIAIQTTIPSFKESFALTQEHVYAGKVIYIDYDTDVFYRDEGDAYPFINTLVPFIHKRSIYAHEHEYRAILDNPTRDLSFVAGRHIRVQLDQLIKTVVLAPSTPQWIFNLVCSELKGVLSDVEVQHSTFDDLPLC